MNLCFLDMVRTCGALVEDDENIFFFHPCLFICFYFWYWNPRIVFSMGVTFFTSMMYRKL